ncbi:glycosyltransferase [Fodinisporobacter ferrooxydans]|uniref:Glycosyltransferase n=1 Tax=Fodinisporobacter ferrooxydans TaxID=2901836 RepID=A0ABY4CN01_9BACL|nr:glycosyltransferase [Alicyclobacillaceae bacterium MYW30-H2]
MYNLTNLTEHSYRMLFFQQALPLHQFLTQMTEILNTIKTEWVLWPPFWEVWRVNNAAALESLLKEIPPTVTIASISNHFPNLEHSSLLRNPLLSNEPILWRNDWLKKQLAIYDRHIPDKSYIPYDIALNTNTTIHYSMETYQRFGLTKLFQSQTVNARRTAEHKLILPILRQQTETNTSYAILTRQPKISIVICAYNESSRIGWAIRSVLKQTYANWELIVIDDGSTDGTHAVVESFPDHRIKLKRLAANRGKAFALNDALTMVEGSYMLELDADDWIPPESIREFVNVLPDIDDTVAILTSNYFRWRRSMKGRLSYEGVEPSAQLEVAQNRAKPIIPRFYRTQALQTLNGWPILDGPLSRLYEDIAICLRLQKTYQIHSIDKPLYHRVIRPTSISQTNQSNYTKWLKNYNELFPSTDCES